MISITELSREWDIPYKRLNRWVHEFGLGTKVGWAIVLREDEVDTLRSLLKEKKVQGVGQRGRPLCLGGAGA